MTSPDQSPRPLAAAIVLLAAILMISRLIIERAPARDWVIPLLLLALGIGLLLWDSFARRPRTSWPSAASTADSDHTIRVAVPAAAPSMPAAVKPPAPIHEPEPSPAEPPAPVHEPEPPPAEPPAPVHEPEPPPAEPPAPVHEPEPPPAEPPAPVHEPEPPPAEPRKRASKAAAKEPVDKQPSRKRAAAGDDLTLIEGIGPKISAALIAAGIGTFADLAAAPEARVREILAAAQLRIVGSVSESIPTWAEQAGLAAEGRLDDLKAWQTAHKSGKG